MLHQALLLVPSISNVQDSKICVATRAEPWVLSIHSFSKVKLLKAFLKPSAWLLHEFWTVFTSMPNSLLGLKLQYCHVTHKPGSDGFSEETPAPAEQPPERSSKDSVQTGASSVPLQGYIPKREGYIRICLGMLIWKTACANTVSFSFGPPMCNAGVKRQTQIEQLLSIHKN